MDTRQGPMVRDDPHPGRLDEFGVERSTRSVFGRSYSRPRPVPRTLPFVSPVSTPVISRDDRSSHFRGQGRFWVLGNLTVGRLSIRCLGRKPLPYISVATMSVTHSPLICSVVGGATRTVVVETVDVKTV